jgi:hypothetical protein
MQLVRPTACEPFVKRWMVDAKEYLEVMALPQETIPTVCLALLLATLKFLASPLIPKKLFSRARMMMMMVLYTRGLRLLSLDGPNSNLVIWMR